MANTLRLKRSAVSGRVPATTDLSLGEVAINTNDGRVFLKKDDGTEAIVEVIADDGAGNVGIGTTSPDTSLEVVSSGATGISSKSASTQATDTNKALKVRNNSTTDTFNVSYKGQGYFAGKVGIGTTSPSDVLHLSKSDATSVGLRLSNTEGVVRIVADNDLVAISADQHRFTTESGTERMRIDSSGNVGIGVATVDSPLHVYKQSSDRTARFQRISTQYIDIIQTSGINEFESTGKSFAIGTSDSNPITLRTNDSERMRIDSAGKVGIGRSSPREALDVQGNVELTGQLHQSMPSDFWSQGNTFIELNGMGNLTHMGGYETTLTSNGYRDTNAQWVSYGINSTTGASQIRVNPTGYIAFGTESNKADGSTHVVTERMRINSSGKLGIGTSSPRNRLDVTNSSPSDAGGIFVQNVNYANNQDKPYFIIGTSGWTGATTNWNTYGFQHKIKTDSAGIPRVTIDSAHGEAFCVRNDRRVGIGTTSPGKELDVQGSIRSVGTSATIGLPVGTTAQRPGSPAQGDLRFNSTDTAAEIYDGSAWSAVGSGGGATGGGSDQWAVEHDNTITASYTISSGKNVISAGPLTVNNGAVVTVPSGSNWVIV